MSTFTPPGPGVWELEATHTARPASRLLEEVLPAAMSSGFAEGAERYGLMLRTIEIRFVNRFAYMCARPVGAPPSAKAPPPKPVFKLLTRLHPAMRQRVRRAQQVLDGKLWRSDLDRWDREVKPATIRRQSALLAEDPRALSDADLGSYLTRCRDNYAAMIHQHHHFTLPCCFPVGDYLAQASAWTGLPVARLLALLKGASPDSQAAGEELAHLVAALQANPDGWRALEGDAATVLAALQVRDDAIGEAARVYVTRVGHRTNGHDLTDPCALETPQALVDAIRRGFHGSPAAAQPASDELSAVRTAVPEPHHAAFDELLAEARLLYRLRDERALYSDTWAAGVARRAWLAAGERLAGQGRLRDALHMLEAGHDEAQALLKGAGPSADELAARAAYRTARTTSDAPEFLGGKPAPPPPAAWLPTAASRRVQDATLAVIGNIFNVVQEAPQANAVQGMAVNPGVYEGTARLVLGPESFDRVRQGDVLVTRTTSPAFNIVLPLLGAVVTDRGGVLCHTAIVAREYGIPAVVGTRCATTTIPDGARVRVDGTTGRVEVLS